VTADLKANGRSNGSDLSGANAIEVDRIVKKYGDFTAVDQVSFQVKEGEIFGLLGPNGAGKSTLIRMMTTLIPITAGKAYIAGHDVQKDPDSARRAIGVIPQALTSDLDLTIEENLNIYAKLYDVPAKKRKAAIDELLELVDLTKWRDAQTKTLSGGMRRRLEIARGLVHSPRIFFLDEPTTSRANASSPSSSPPITWTKPIAFAIASPLSITANWLPSTLHRLSRPAFPAPT
jgi:ABC-type multidrug transport system ATPase subunit